jgi:hypothetical protein
MLKKQKLELTEKQIQNVILEWLNLNGHYCWRNNTGMVHMENKDGSIRQWRAGIKGSSDILGVSKDGRFIAIECKRVGKKATEIQQYFLDEIEKRGGVAIVATSLDHIINHPAFKGTV